MYPWLRLICYDSFNEIEIDTYLKVEYETKKPFEDLETHIVLPFLFSASF